MVRTTESDNTVNVITAECTMAKNITMKAPPRNIIRFMFYQSVYLYKPNTLPNSSFKSFKSFAILDTLKKSEYHLNYSYFYVRY